MINVNMLDTLQVFHECKCHLRGTCQQCKGQSHRRSGVVLAHLCCTTAQNHKIITLGVKMHPVVALQEATIHGEGGVHTTGVDWHTVIGSITH